MTRIQQDDELIMIDPTSDVINYWTTLVQGTEEYSIKVQNESHVEVNLFENAGSSNKKPKPQKREARKRIKTILENCTFPSEQVKKVIESYVDNTDFMNISIDKLDLKTTFLFDVCTEAWISAKELETKGLLKKIEDHDFDWSAFEQAKELVFLNQNQADFDRKESEKREPTPPKKQVEEKNDKNLKEPVFPHKAVITPEKKKDRQYQNDGEIEKEKLSEEKTQKQRSRNKELEKENERENTRDSGRKEWTTTNKNVQKRFENSSISDESSRVTFTFISLKPSNTLGQIKNNPTHLHHKNFKQNFNCNPLKELKKTPEKWTSKTSREITSNSKNNFIEIDTEIPKSPAQEIPDVVVIDSEEEEGQMF